MSRVLKDDELLVTLAVPAANANADSDGIKILPYGTIFPTNEVFGVEVAFEAMANLANDTDITVTLLDSADGETYEAIPSLGALSVTGAGGAGSAATAFQVRLPDTTRAYIAMNVAAEANSGNNVAKSVSLRLTF